MNEPLKRDRFNASGQGKAISMTCPYLWGMYLRSCSAARGIHVPDRADREQYCAPPRNTGFPLCPLYLRAFWRSQGTERPRCLAPSEHAPKQLNEPGYAVDRK